MTTAPSVAHAKAPAAIGFFERNLTVRVALCIVAGTALGQLLPGAFRIVGSLGVTKVNVPVGVPIRVMKVAGPFDLRPETRRRAPPDPAR